MAEEDRLHRACLDGRSDSAVLAHSAGNANLLKDILAKEQPSDAELNRQDADGRTPLQWAATSDERLEIVRLLFGAGKIDVNVQDRSGWTPLMIAASSGAEKIVDELLAQCVFLPSGD